MLHSDAFSSCGPSLPARIYKLSKSSAQPFQTVSIFERYRVIQSQLFQNQKVGYGKLVPTPLHITVQKVLVSSRHTIPVSLHRFHFQTYPKPDLYNIGALRELIWAGALLNRCHILRGGQQHIPWIAPLFKWLVVLLSLDLIALSKKHQLSTSLQLARSIILYP